LGRVAKRTRKPDAGDFTKRAARSLGLTLLFFVVFSGDAAVPTGPVLNLNPKVASRDAIDVTPNGFSQ
jgi:hypothetical protein